MGWETWQPSCSLWAASTSMIRLNIRAIIEESLSLNYTHYSFSFLHYLCICVIYIFVKIKGSELNCILSASSVMIHHPFALFTVRNICSCSARLALGNLGAPEQLPGLIENGEFLKYQFQKRCWPCCPKPFKVEISNSLWDILTLLPLEALNQKI